jgi:hypothetical protein
MGAVGALAGQAHEVERGLAAQVEAAGDGERGAAAEIVALGAEPARGFAQPSQEGVEIELDRMDGAEAGGGAGGGVGRRGAPEQRQRGVTVGIGEAQQLLGVGAVFVGHRMPASEDQSREGEAGRPRDQAPPEVAVNAPARTPRARVPGGSRY